LQENNDGLQSNTKEPDRKTKLPQPHQGDLPTEKAVYIADFLTSYSAIKNQQIENNATYRCRLGIEIAAGTSYRLCQTTAKASVLGFESAMINIPLPPECIKRVEISSIGWTKFIK